MTRVISVSIESWSEFSIKDICINISSGGTPSRKVPEYYLNGVHKWIKTQELKDCNIYDTDEHITDAALKNSSAKIYPKNTISMAMYGATVGKLGIMKSECATNQACCNMVVDSTKADYRFLFYSLLYRREELIGLASGAAQQNLNVGVISNFRINLPTLSEQKVIAATLSVLDDMIELNNKINKTLEEMAQAIFKSWFVDFEPFKDGEFENSELGLIPKGWRVGKLSDVGEIIGGGTPSKSKPEYYSEIGIPWITPKDLSINKNKYISRGEIDISELGLRESSARLMPKGTVLFSSRAPIGYIAIAKNAVTTNQGFKSVVPFENISSEYIYLLLKNSINEIESRATGSTFKEISGGEMKKVPIILPPKEIIRKFNEIATTLGKTQASLEDENNILMSIRDTLLPKLMSGEIRVPVEEVV